MFPASNRLNVHVARREQFSSSLVGESSGPPTASGRRPRQRKAHSSTRARQPLLLSPTFEMASTPPSPSARALSRALLGSRTHQTDSRSAPAHLQAALAHSACRNMLLLSTFGTSSKKYPSCEYFHTSAVLPSRRPGKTGRLVSIQPEWEGYKCPG